MHGQLERDGDDGDESTTSPQPRLLANCSLPLSFSLYTESYSHFIYHATLETRFKPTSQPLSVAATRASGKDNKQHGHLWSARRCITLLNNANCHDAGLLPLLKSIHKPCNLKKFSGQTIGVDAYGWLHRGTAACAIDLALDKPTTKCVSAVLHWLTG
jgi:hypothetical protein